MRGGLQERKATKREILEFIRLKEVIYYWQLAEEFGYTRQTAKVKLNTLSKQGLVTPLKPAERPRRWILTNKGEDRLLYLKTRQHAGE